MEREFECIILGGGPAGLSASIYCARANVSCCIIEPSIVGGRPLGYLEIENYLGLGKTSTLKMLEKFTEHVELFNIPVFECEAIENVDLDNKVVKTTDNVFKAKTIIIATGSRPKLLNVKGEEEFTGKGVHYCAICDGHFYKDKVVAVIGGGNSACEEALGLSKIAKKVYIIEFTSKLNADAITLEKIKETENIEVICDAEVQDICGSKKVEYITIGTGFEAEEITVDAVFPYIGMTANSEMFNVEKDNNGFIFSNEYLQTSKEGIFVAGDIRVKVLRQVITAVADGAVAGVQVSRYLQ